MKKIILLLCLYFSLFFVTAQSGEWTWLHGRNIINSAGNIGVQGVPSPANNPPALYEACEWTDTSGKFWMYGGLDYEGQIHNVLWKYDPVDSEWTWMNGTNAIDDAGNYGVKGVSAPTNRPPSFGYGVTTWVDLNDNLWMFGGDMTGNGPSVADLWKYNIGTNEWTWINGPDSDNPKGIY